MTMAHPGDEPPDNQAFEASDPQSTGTPRSDDQGPETPSAWLIRAGGKGERAASFINDRIAAVGFGKLGDLSGVSGRDEIGELVKEDWPEASEAQVRSRASQLRLLQSEIRRGDLIVTPRENSSSFALGTVSRGYWYRHDAETMRHTVSVDWQQSDVPRTAMGEDLLSALRLRKTVNPIRSKDAARRLQQLLETGQDPGPRAEATGSSELGKDLTDLVEQFYSVTGYPTDAHKEQARLREEWARKLSRENFLELSRSEFYRIASNATRGNYKYVYTGDSSPNRWITEMPEQRFTAMLKSLEYLCWGDDDVAHRIEEISNEQYGTIPSKFLAICHPDRFLPIGVLDGSPGTLQMLERLGLSEPSGESYGEWVVEANDRLREHVASYFDDDPIAIAAFMYWLMNQDEPHRPVDLAGLADKLLVEVGFLRDIVSLLEDKGQVILYGPPGTGKTYLARALARVLATDESRRALVQFHPSTSYEDFFEGYRPAGTGDAGEIRYELTPGPLARMAKRASESSEQHVMIIDEINRGNLPRVLGELLFLLEYRNESVQTLYRLEEPFSLPKNLWFIGTMNTADRSIALVDAALRRRFHFVPFFPDREPMAGLLGRWLKRENEPAWVGRLVDAVNHELKAELEGSHLLLGPSHFMTEYSSSRDTQRERLRRIWKYNIEPFIEDQFFGDPDRIEHFRFEAVWNRHDPSDGRDVGTGEDPRGSEVGLASAGSDNDGELWMRRASEFPPRDHAGDESYHAEIRQVVQRYVEFALTRGANPGHRNDQGIEEFLFARKPEYADSTKTNYRRHINEWFDYVDGTWGT